MYAGGEVGEGLPVTRPTDHLRGGVMSPAMVGSSSVAMVAAVLGSPVVWLFASLVAVALALSRGARHWVEGLPGGAVLLFATTMSLPLFAGLVGANVLVGTFAPRAMLVLGMVAAVGWAWLLAADDSASVSRSRTELALAAAPSILMLGLLVVVAIGASSRLSWFLSGDHLRHLGLTTRTVEAGALEYGMLSYPHGWHAVMATMWAATGSGKNGAGLQAMVELQAVATWTLLVLVPLTLGLTAATLARGCDLGPRLAGVSGLVAGSLVLGPAFYGDYVPRGFETTILVLLAVAAAIQVSVAAPTSTAALAVAVAATVVTAHAWQVLLVPIGLLTSMALWRRCSWRSRGRTLWGEGLTLGLGILVSLPGVAAAFGGFGLGAAAEAGDVPPPVLGWFFMALVSIAIVVLTVRRTKGAIATVAVAVLVTFLTSALLAWLAGVGLSSYYPSKTLWVAAVLGLAGVGAAVGVALRALDGSSLLRRAGFVGIGTVAGLAVVVSLATPVMGVLRNAWGAADSETVMQMVTSGQAPAASVVWHASNAVDDATAQLLLDFYSATVHTPRLGLAATDVEGQCALLQAAKPPVVISTAPVREVRDRFSCVPGVEVVSPWAP